MLSHFDGLFLRQTIPLVTDTEFCNLKKFEYCTTCHEPIFDKFLMRVGDQFWHEHCLSCCICGTILNQSCFFRQQKIYCKYDYECIFTIKCSRCQQQIKSDDLIMRAQNFIYHITCFQCDICLRPLQKGDHFIVDTNGKLICEKDFDICTSSHNTNSLLLMNAANLDTEVDTDIDADVDIDPDVDPDDLLLYDSLSNGKMGSKRPRTILTTIQRKLFKAAFDLSPKPCRKTRENLAKETGLNIRVVQVWFQNQRAKIKKIEKKSKSINNNVITKNANNNNNRTRSKHKIAMIRTMADNSLNNSDISMDDSSVLSDSYSMNDVDLTDTFSLKSPMDHLFSMQNFYFDQNEEQHIDLF